MSILMKSFCSAFLMYSRIPMPQVEWKEENRRWALCFFPLIGEVIGVALVTWYHLCRLFGWGEWLFAAVSAAIPILVTGGIHMDGFCDVCDAKASCGSREKMLAIMSDSHIGAFAAIKTALYLLVQAGIFSQLFREKSVELLTVGALIFVLSRALSGLAAVTFRSAKTDGNLQNFVKPAHKAVTVAVEIFFIALTGPAMLLMCPSAGIGAIIGAAVTFVYYRIFAYRTFGGIAGDLAGYFLQLCELIGMGGAVLGYTIGSVLL